MKGIIHKMHPTHKSPVEYELPIGDERLPMNQFIGKTIRLNFTNHIECVSCQRKINKTYNQGYCFPCFKKLAACDFCIMNPEKCHFDAGTCREPEWGLAHCMQPHIVYLANSSGLKVGITREVNVPTRWMDQGAEFALPIFRVMSRLQSGVLEVILKQHMNDKTNWRKMLSGNVDPIDLEARRDEVLPEIKKEVEAAFAQFSDHALEELNEKVLAFNYPVEEFPEKVKSLSFDKTPEIQGKLMGIKGQYLILEEGVLNIRKFGGYEVEITG